MQDERALIQRVLARKPGAFKELVERYQKLVWQVVYRVTNNHSDCEEMCQEVFLQVFSSLERFRAESKLSTWIAKISYTTACRHMQKSSNRMLTMEQPALDNYIEADDISQTDSIETSLIKNIEKQALATLIQQLSELQQLIVTLFYYQEFNVKEIALIVELPENTIKSHLRRARLFLSDQLKQPNHHTGDL